MAGDAGRGLSARIGMTIICLPLAIRRDKSGLLHLIIDRLLEGTVEPLAFPSDFRYIVQIGFDRDAELV